MRVWRNITICLVVWMAVGVASVYAQLAAVPTYRGYVTDTANLINAGDKQKIETWAAELDRKTSAQVAVLTLRSTQPEEIAQYSVRVFDQWKIGDAAKDNGVLILVAVDDRKAWITTGYGMEGAIPDVIASRVVQDIMVPRFKESNYSRGILEGSTAIISLAAKEYDVQITGQEVQYYERVREKSSSLNEVIQMIFVFLFVLFVMSGRGGLWPLLLLGGGGRGYGRSYGGSGGFGGGFGGFGGGMSGGGGGGGGW